MYLLPSFHRSLYMLPLVEQMDLDAICGFEEKYFVEICARAHGASHQHSIEARQSRII